MTETTKTLDPDMHEFLSGVVGAVEANSFEQHMLWVENRRRQPPRGWKHHGIGRHVTAGVLADMPVCLSLFTAEVGGFKILFFDAVSQVVDHRMVDQWLTDNLPSTARSEGGRINRTDANNFPNIFPREAVAA